MRPILPSLRISIFEAIGWIELVEWLIYEIEPVGGTVNVDGKDITHVPIEKRNIGIVFQSYALFPTMTVYDNIAFGLKIQKLSRAEIDKKVRDIAKKVDLSDEQLKKAV